MCMFSSRHGTRADSTSAPLTAPRSQQVVSPQTSTGNPSPGPNSPTLGQISPTDVSPGLVSIEPASPKYGNFGSCSVPGTPPPLPPRNRRRESSVSEISSPQQVNQFATNCATHAKYNIDFNLLLLLVMLSVETGPRRADSAPEGHESSTAAAQEGHGGLTSPLTPHYRP